MADVLIERAPRKAFEKLDPRVKLRIREAFRELASWPDVRGTTPLKGDPGRHRKRVGDYRIVFRMEGETVVIERIAHRREVYEQ